MAERGRLQSHRPHRSTDRGHPWTDRDGADRPRDPPAAGQLCGVPGTVRVACRAAPDPRGEAFLSDGDPQDFGCWPDPEGLAFGRSTLPDPTPTGTVFILDLATHTQVATVTGVGIDPYNLVVVDGAVGGGD
jgi:hypothetical protein